MDPPHPGLPFHRRKALKDAAVSPTREAVSGDTPKKVLPSGQQGQLPSSNNVINKSAAVREAPTAANRRIADESVMRTRIYRTMNSFSFGTTNDTGAPSLRETPE